MKKLQYHININAKAKDVWNKMMEDETYRIWTSAFSEGSFYEGSWRKGEKIKFLIPSGDGMVSEIADNIPNEFLSIKHLGFIKNGIEDTTSDEIKAWAPSFENYLFKQQGNETQLSIEVDATDDFADYMDKTWPKALAKLKEICEAK